MEFNGLVIETNSFTIFSETASTYAGGNEGALGYAIAFNVADNLAVSQIEMTYYKSEKLHLPLAYLKTTLKFWIDQNNIDVEATERILYSIKSQSSYMIFMLYQKFNSLNITGYRLISRPDKVFYDAINPEIGLTELEFDDTGNYCFPF